MCELETIEYAVTMETHAIAREEPIQEDTEEETHNDE